MLSLSSCSDSHIGTLSPSVRIPSAGNPSSSESVESLVQSAKPARFQGRFEVVDIDHTEHDECEKEEPRISMVPVIPLSVSMVAKNADSNVKMNLPLGFESSSPMIPGSPIVLMPATSASGELVFGRFQVRDLGENHCNDDTEQSDLLRKSEIGQPPRYHISSRQSSLDEVSEHPRSRNSFSDASSDDSYNIGTMFEMLRNKVDLLVAECKSLRLENQRLSQENSHLKAQVLAATIETSSTLSFENSYGLCRTLSDPGIRSFIPSEKMSNPPDYNSSSDAFSNSVHFKAVQGSDVHKFALSKDTSSEPISAVLGSNLIYPLVEARTSQSRFSPS